MSIEDLADPDQSQWFLTSEHKIQILVKAADIEVGDRVIELGGGIGTITAHLPATAEITTTELDEKIAAILTEQVPPHVNVVVGDGLEYIRNHDFDVLISSIPTELAENMIRSQLPQLSWRTAIVAIEPDTDTADLETLYSSVEIITTAEGHDYRPFQPCVSRFIRLAQKPNRG